VSAPLFKQRDQRARTSRLALQVLHRRELAESGRRIKAGREDNQRELRRIASFLPGARHAGLTMTEISELTGMSRPTLYQLQTGKAGDDRDPTVTLLNALGGLGPQTAEQLAGVMRIAETIVARTIEDLVARQLVSIAVGYYTAGSQTAFVMLTEAGVELLQTLLTRPE
jgi:transcriptional regulator with XRE-family HTH domain